MPAHHIPRLDFELTPACDHKCGHCYNVWGADPGDPQGSFELQPQLPTPELMALMTKAVEQTQCEHLTLTGGEPLLRKDALQLVKHATSLVPSVQIITNGSHVPESTARFLADCGVRSVQLTLLAGTRALHDELKGAVCFDDTCRAALNLADAGVPTQCCFVAMDANRGELERVMELCLVLGIRQLVYNRMSPTGGAIHHIARLMPTPEQLDEDLDTLERVGRAYGIAAATAMPIPPCLVRTERYPWVQLGFCSTGTESPNIVVDGAANVRSCNLAGGVLGNLVEQDWEEIHANPYQAEFKRNLPEMCRECAYATSCQGGCKESAFATFGDHTHPEPLVWLAMDPERRDRLRARVPQKPGPTGRSGPRDA
ncbi:MAG: radical SAM protein [Myxococcota bacterium]